MVEKKKNSNIEGKDYKAAFDAIAAKSVFEVTDLDTKAVALLDELQKSGRAEEAATYLFQAIGGLERERVKNWRAYTYTLLRGFDEKAYNAMKETVGGRRPRGPREKTEKGEEGERKPGSGKKKGPLAPFTFSAVAVEFVPGAAWGGAERPSDQRVLPAKDGEEEGTDADAAKKDGDAPSPDATKDEAKA